MRYTHLPSCVTPSTPRRTDSWCTTRWNSGAGLIDSVLASGTKSGYVFSISTGGGTPATIYTVNGDPQNSQTGQRHFFSDQSGVIRYNASATASAGDAPLQ